MSLPAFKFQQHEIGLGGSGHTPPAHALTPNGLIPRAWHTAPIDDAPPAPGALLPIPAWLHHFAGATSPAPAGVLVAPADDPLPLRPHLAAIPAIAIDFPTWKDGRGYSHARRLRHHFGYTGPLIAVGDVRRDQLHYLWRSGFDHFHLHESQDPTTCLAAFRLYSEFYQYPPRRA